MKTSRPRNIILIVADSLRYDSVYQNGDPLLPYASRNGVHFSQARTSGCWTLPAHASLFTGLTPHEHGATSQTRRLDASIPTLAQRLKASGYRTHQVTSNVVTTDLFGIDRGFDQVDKIWEMVTPRFKSLFNTFILLAKPRVRRLLLSKDGISHQLTKDLRVGKCWVQNTHKNIFRRSRRVLRQNESKGESTFLFMNLMETHFPYHVGPTFRLSADAWTDRLSELAGLYHMVNQSFLTSDSEYIPPRIAEILRNRQRKSWRLLSKSLDRFLRDLHEDKENLVIFLSDHGDNFGDQGWFYHFSNVTDAGNRVPVFWLGHDHRPSEILDHPVSTRFVFDSILEAAGVEHAGPGLFEPQPNNLPILESYWYDNHGNTLPKYRYNQMAFVEGDQRYLLREGEWWHASRQNGTEHEPEFVPFENGADPIEDFVEDPERREYLRQSASRFQEFSATIPR